MPDPGVAVENQARSRCLDNSRPGDVGQPLEQLLSSEEGKALRGTKKGEARGRSRCWKEAWPSPGGVSVGWIRRQTVRLETVCGGFPLYVGHVGVQLRSKIIVPPSRGLFGRVQWEADSTWVGG